MKIICHRGLWKNPLEKNTKGALENALVSGFGIETDIRDLNQKIVISHDSALHDSMSLESLFMFYKNNQLKNFLALNIKADGLHQSLESLIIKYQIQNYFVFDMSVPETIQYKNRQIKFYSRLSEYEPTPIFYSSCDGIWLDCFESIWYSTTMIEKYLTDGKKVAIVSPELHKRQHTLFWEQLRDFRYCDELYLCTDFPEDAKKKFYDSPNH